MTTALTLPDEATFRSEVALINRFQQVVHASLVEGLDFGLIPGTQRPALLKAGAEKIVKLLGLADVYEIIDRVEDWNKPFFRYLIKCKLIHISSGALITEGMGECNSFETKYRYRWTSERDLPSEIDKTKLVTQERHARNGGHWTVYRLDNEEIFSQVNTILKMAKKRALVDSALSAGRLSDVFTQDIEDLDESSISKDKGVVKKFDSGKTSPATQGPTDDFKNPGDFFTACLKNFGITRTQVQAEFPTYDFKKIGDIKKAWEELVKIHEETKGDGNGNGESKDNLARDGSGEKQISDTSKEQTGTA